MLLKRIRLLNFRQYIGEQTVDFSPIGERNVTVLIGKNTGGKTTFVQAFRWVLYDDDDFTGGKRKTQILNANVASELRKGEDACAEVELKLLHNNIEYTITRTQKYKSRETATASEDGSSILKVLYKTETGETKRVDNRDVDKINEMLPHELSEYFFFDGEKIKKVTEKKNIETAVNSIMGLTPLTNMQNHLLDLEKKYESELVDDGSGDVKRYTFLKDKCEKEIDTYRSKIEDNEKLIAACEKIRDETFKEMKEIEEIKKDVEKRKELQDAKSGFDRLKRQKERDIISGFNKSMLQVYSYPLAMKTKDLLKQEDMNDKGIPEMSSAAINYIVKSGKCICGRDICNDEDALKHITELLEYLPPASIGTQIKDLLKEIKRIEMDVPSKMENIRETYNSYLNILEKRYNNERDLDALDLKLKNVPNTEAIQTKYNDANKEWASAVAHKIEYNNNLEQNKKTLEEYDKELDKIARQTKLNESTNLAITYVKELYAHSVYLSNKKSSNNLEKMRSIIGDVFNNMYHGDRTISIDDRYGVTLGVSKYGNTKNLDASTGLDTVKNFAFVATLLKMAKDSMVEDENGISSEPYPLVMDAAFSNTDEIHIRKISEQLPKLAQQTIIALMDKDWKYASSTLEPKVHKIYRLNKISETETRIEMEESHE